MSKANIRQFADFSKLKLSELQLRVEKVKSKRKPGRYAFVGNMANINYIRALPLRRRGLNVDLILHPQDDFLFAQPAWEDFDGEITELGDNPSKVFSEAKLPNWVHRHREAADWASFPLNTMVATPKQILLWPEYMTFLPTLAALSHYDSLLVSQFPYFGFFSGRPYLFGQIGGDIWLEASRNDAFGILARRAIAASSAVLVSNPITLAHARRYGLHNLLYVPLPLDEDVYSPGGADDIRADWRGRVGGDFFVLTSMRMDRRWKGAQHALDGFARFASRAPEARLVVLGWGEDLEFAKSQMAELSLQERVIFLPAVGKKRLVRYLRAADLAIEQFILGYYGASGLEAMACGKPVIMRMEREQYEGLIDVGVPPILHAENGGDVERHLQKLYEERALCRQIGEQSREWFIKAQSSQRWFETYRLLLQAISAGIPLSFAGSPLLKPLSQEEEEYHAAQLASAPPFPNYVD
jgi:glycosyltransferase involved in cell wall biosynthesis